MKTVFFQGAFDILNAGHVMALKRARGLGDRLIVGLNTDELHKSYKDNRGPVIPYEERKVILEAIRWVDEVIPMNTFSPIKELKKYDVDVYIITREWLKSKTKELAYMSKKGGVVDFSPRFDEELKVMCSTDIREKIGERFLASNGVW